MNAESTIKAWDAGSAAGTPLIATVAGLPDQPHADLVRLAALVCEADFASLAPVGCRPAWATPQEALPGARHPDGDPFFVFAAGVSTPFEVADAASDERFVRSPLTVDDRAVRSYAGLAMRGGDGALLGVLAVYGARARRLTPVQLDCLQLVARQAAAMIELRGGLTELALLSPGPAPPDMAHALLESAPVAIYHTDASNKVGYVNPEYRRLFGLQPGQGDDDWATALHVEDRARIEEAWEDFCRRPRPVKFEYRLRPDSGIDRYFCEQLVPTRGFPGYVGTISDFTDLMTARGSLRKAETLFLHTFDQAPIGIAYADAQGRFLRCNPAFCALLGFNPESLASRSSSELIHDEDRACSSGELEKLWRGAVEFVDIEKRYRCSDGRYVWVRATTALVRDASGVPDCAVEFLRDISSRKKLAAALMQQQTLLETVITDLPVALIACDTSGSITHHNRAALELHCMQIAGDATQTFLADGTTPLLERERPLVRALRGETISDLELIIAPQGAERRTTLSSARRLIGPAGEILGAVAVVQDITERKQADINLERVHKELMTASRQAGMAEVATNVLHNVGNILNSVNISASLVADRVKQSKASGLSRLAALLKEQGAGLGDYMSGGGPGSRIPDYLASLGEQLVADQQMTLRELGSLRDNLEHIKDTVAMQQNYAKLCGVVETVEVADLVEDSLRLNAGAFVRHGVTLERDFRPVPPITVDKHKVLQILVNLVRNAKYACDESGRMDKIVILRIETAPGGVRVAVIDNGVGIPRENMGRLFSHGFTTRQSGHGFGLHSGALAAQDLGGTLRAESDGPGRGAAFILELPCAPAQAGARA